MPLLQEIKVPLLAVNDTTLTVVEIAVSNGAKIKAGDLLMVFETSKTTYEVHAETDGFIQVLAVAQKDYEVDTVVALIYSSADEVDIHPVDNPVGGVSATFNHNHHSSIDLTITHPFEGNTKYSQYAIQLMQKYNVDPQIFAGWDLVSGDDVEKIALNKRIEKSLEISPKVVEDFKKERLPANTTSKPISGNKKREIEYLSAVQQTGLTSTVYLQVNTGLLYQHINRHLKYFKNALLPVIIYECGRLLRKYSLFNAFYDQDFIHYYNQVNIGFAIDIDKGLKVVKLQNADEETIDSIEKKILNLSEQYLDDKLKVEDLTDITFTVTDLSNEGVGFFKPLINKYNSAILGISAEDKKNKTQMLSLTFDHRVTEGKLAAIFLNELKNNIESFAGKGEAIIERPEAFCYKCLKTLNEDLSLLGLFSCITPQGKDGYICSSCLNGHS